jgi:SPP1 gp7 family putative phage head morphogenesis protein
VSNNYWVNRARKAQDAATARSVKETEKILKKYYSTSAQKILGQFEQTYQHLLSSIEKGREPTPADLYKLDKYWQLQGQLRRELQKLGDRKISLLTKMFETNYFEVYYSFALPSQSTYSKLDTRIAQQVINSIWCADGKTWSQRIWGNIDKLQASLNENLIDCVISGRKPGELKKLLQERFNVSYSRADALVRTEMTHIQTQAAKKRYEDYGLKEYEILGNDDDSCGNHSVDCHKMHGKRFLYAQLQEGVNAPPFHPRCKCCILPVIPK